MVCNIYKVSDSEMYIDSSDYKFKSAYGIIKCSKNTVFTKMQEISRWVKEEFNEEIYFEVEY